MPPRGIDIGIFAAYIIVVMGVGMYAARKGKATKRDYFLAGDKLPWWMVGGSIVAANISSHHFIGVMGTAYARGFIAMTIEWGAIFLGLNALLWIFLPFYLRNGFYTMPEFLQHRYGSAARTIFAGLILLVYIFIEISAVLFLGAIAINSLLGIPLFVSIICLAIFTGFYTVMGGLRAVVWTEMLQLCVLLTGGIVLSVATIHAAGGWSAVMATSKDWHLLLPATDPDFPWTLYLGGATSVYYFAANQFIVQRVLGAKNEWHARMGVVFTDYLKFLLPLNHRHSRADGPHAVSEPGKAGFRLSHLGEKLAAGGFDRAGHGGIDRGDHESRFRGNQFLHHHRHRGFLSPLFSKECHRCRGGAVRQGVWHCRRGVGNPLGHDPVELFEKAHFHLPHEFLRIRDAGHRHHVLAGDPLESGHPCRRLGGRGRDHSAVDSCRANGHPSAAPERGSLHHAVRKSHVHRLLDMYVDRHCRQPNDEAKEQGRVERADLESRELADAARATGDVSRLPSPRDLVGNHYGHRTVLLHQVSLSLKMLLGLDLGTTNVKAVAVDAGGRVVADGCAPVQRFHTPDGGVEQDIEEIWDAVVHAVRPVVAQVDDPTRIRAIGISSQGGALQLLGAGQKPVGRVISWLDGRGKPFNDRLTHELGEDFFTEHLGRTPSAITPGQVLRLQQQTPEWSSAVAGIGYVGDVVVGRLCGRRAHDATSLSIAMLYNPSLGRADPAVLRRLQIREEQLPDLLPATTPAGALRDKAAREMGLRAGIPVSAAIHDQYAASLGAGSVEEGDVCLGTGTAWVLVANTSRPTRPVTRGAFVCCHPVPGLFGQMLSMNNGGSAIEWVTGLLGLGQLSPEQIDTMVAIRPRHQRRPALLAATVGQRSGQSFPRTGRPPCRSHPGARAGPYGPRRAGRFGLRTGTKPGMFHGGRPSRAAAHSLRRRGGQPGDAADHCRRYRSAGGVRDPEGRQLARGCRGSSGDDPTRRNLASLARQLASTSRTVQPGKDARAYARLLQQYLRPFADRAAGDVPI